MRLVLTAFLFIIGFIANAAACDGGDAVVRYGTAETGVGIAAGVAVGLHVFNIGANLIINGEIRNKGSKGHEVVCERM
jgi:hypothetical protein